MQKITIPTPLGDLIATPSADPDHPGISLDLDSIDGKGQIPIVYTEYDQNTLVSRVWGNAANEDPTVVERHRRLPDKPSQPITHPDPQSNPKLIYVCAPYKGQNMRHREQNIQNARMYGLHVLRQHMIPYIPHLAVCGFLDDNIPDERTAGIEIDKAMMALCDEIWIFGTTISDGMRVEIKYFQDAGKPVRYVTNIPETPNVSLS